MQWVHFPLHPGTPREGQLLTDLFPGRDLRPMHQRMQQLMEAEGLPFSARTHTYNSRLAQELGAWADTQPGGEAIHDALFRAYFVEGRNIGEIGVLADIARAVGLPADEARAVLTERRFKAAVDHDWDRSRAAGVTGVPTFACGGHQVVGAQPYEVIEELVVQAGARPRTSGPSGPAD